MIIIIIIGLLSLFLIWTILFVKGKFHNIDKKIYDSLTIKEPFTSILRTITNLASTKYFFMIGFIFLLFLNDKILALAICVLLILNSGLIGLLKNTFKRERPNIKRLVVEKGFSYPSGHTMSATSFYGFIIFLVVISAVSLPFKIVVISLLVLLILTIGFSRIYLGVHYFSDVGGALLVASSYLLLFIYIVHNVLNIV